MMFQSIKNAIEDLEQNLTLTQSCEDPDTMYMTYDTFHYRARFVFRDGKCVGVYMESMP